MAPPRATVLLLLALLASALAADAATLMGECWSIAVLSNLLAVQTWAAE